MEGVVATARAERRFAFEPRVVRGTATGDDEPETGRREPSQGTVAGELFALDLRTGRFRIQDDFGSTLELAVPPALRPAARRLAGERVVAAGSASEDSRGRLHLDVARIGPEDDLFANEVEAFRVATPVDALLEGAVPLSSMEDLAIEDLGQDEAAAFLAALE